MLKKLFLFLFLSIWSAFSQAALVTWNLVDVTFDDGGTATGSFIFDADAFVAHDWNISVSGGNESVFPAFTFTPTTAPDLGVFGVSEGDVTGTAVQFTVDGTALGMTPESRYFGLVTDAPLTNAGGTVSLINLQYFNSVDCYNCNPYRLIVSGSLNAVPVPAAVWLFFSGLIGLIGMTRRKAHA